MIGRRLALAAVLVSLALASCSADAPSPAATRRSTAPERTERVIDFSANEGDAVLPETAYAGSGIATIRSAPESSYCADAVAGVLAAGAYETPTSSLTTRLVDDARTCNGVPLELTFAEPVTRVRVSFWGSAQPYALRAFDARGVLVDESFERAAPYRYGEDVEVEVEADAATIVRVTFGHERSLTLVRSVTFWPRALTRADV